jgi:hypothetical protein
LTTTKFGTSFYPLMDLVQLTGRAIMPYRIRWEGHGVYRRFVGPISAAEFQQAYAEMVSDVRYEGIRYVISDFLEAQPGPDISKRDLAAFAKLERLRYFDSPDTVHATVATNENTLAYARYYGSLRLAHPEATFSTVAEARRWIASNPRPTWRATKWHAKSADPAQAAGP